MALRKSLNAPTLAWFPYHPQKSKGLLMVSLFSFVALVGPLSPEHQVCRGTQSLKQDPGITLASDLQGGDKARELARGSYSSLICL